MNSIQPDVCDCRHVGVNYETGEYEIQIPGATTSGDLWNSIEWIFIPIDIEAYFTVSSHDVSEFLTSSPDVGLENENGFYGFQVMYFENANQYKSLIVEQEIKPGTELFHSFSAIQNPDGTYSIEVTDGMDVLSLEAWRSAIDNIPNELFIEPWRRSSRLGRLENMWARLRKQALKLKFSAVFRILEGGRFESICGRAGFVGRPRPWIEYIRYKLAIWKLEHDILEKLDADGRADWVREPVLVDEIKALISVLRCAGV
jgi:hypothetical protein